MPSLSHASDDCSLIRADSYLAVGGETACVCVWRERPTGCATSGTGSGMEVTGNDWHKFSPSVRGRRVERKKAESSTRLGEVKFVVKAQTTGVANKRAG